MADRGYVSSILNTLDQTLRSPFKLIFDHLLTTFRLGTDTKAANFQWYRIEGTTHSSSNTEFSVAHGLGRVPTHLIPVMDLSLVNSQIVPLTNTRAPDARRIYLSSPSTSASFVAYLEG